MTTRADEHPLGRCAATATLIRRHVGENGRTTHTETEQIACTLPRRHKGPHADPARAWEWGQATVGPERTPKWRKDRGRRR